MNSPADPKTIPPSVAGVTSSSRWKWIALQSALFATLGLIGLVTTWSQRTIHPQMLAILLLVGGVLQAWQSIHVSGWRATLWHFIIATLYAGTGIVVLSRPEQASGLFAALIAGFLFALGISRLSAALRKNRSGGSWYTLASGFGSLVLGGLLLAKWPTAGLFAVGLVVSTDLVLHAISLFGEARAAGKSVEGDLPIES